MGYFNFFFEKSMLNLITILFHAFAVTQSNAQYPWKATTTRFGGSQGSCGGCHLDMFNNVPGWATIATSESMQSPYDCKDCPSCWCATGGDMLKQYNVSGGCGQCFEVKTTGTNPYGATLPVVTFNAMVADSCPFAVNQEWCPQRPGDKSKHGYMFHMMYLHQISRSLVSVTIQLCTSK